MIKDHPFPDPNHPSTSVAERRSSPPSRFCALPLAGCAAANGHAKPTGQQPSPQEQIELDAGVTLKPGIATGAFNNELDDYMWDGTGEQPYGALDTAELRETADAYVVTFTGAFFDPSLATDESDMNFQVGLPSGSGNATLYTGYDFRGVTTGVIAGDDTTVQPLETGAMLATGSFTATYPKAGTILQDLRPDLWYAHVYFSAGASDTSPMSFRCGDGRSWEWQPIAG